MATPVRGGGRLPHPRMSIESFQHKYSIFDKTKNMPRVIEYALHAKLSSFLIGRLFSGFNGFMRNVIFSSSQKPKIDLNSSSKKHLDQSFFQHTHNSVYIPRKKIFFLIGPSNGYFSVEKGRKIYIFSEFRCFFLEIPSKNSN